MPRREYTENQKKFLREIKRMKNVRTIQDRIDYISCAIFYYVKYGLKQFTKRYSSLSVYTFTELKFYLEELQKRKIYLIRLQELDEEKYRKQGLI